MDLILHGNEERNLEYKGSGTWGPTAPEKAKLCKSLMAMANLRDGGAVVFGLQEGPKGVFVPNGLSEAQADTFAPDEIAEFVNGYAAPFVDLVVRRIAHAAALYVVIDVREFAELPVVCRKQGSAGLRAGALYTRSWKPETIEASSEAEMREILDLATEKELRRFLARSARVGLPLAPSEEEPEKFRKEAGGL